MADVFISYKSEDSREAKHIAQALEREGYSVWWDAQLRVGQRYTEEIAAALRAPKAVIVVWSERSAKSDWVREEANLAREAGKLIPVRIASIRPPPPFGQFECAELVEWDGRASDPDWTRVLNAIADLVGGRARDARSASIIAPSAPILSSSAGTIAMEDVIAVTSKRGWGGNAGFVQWAITALAFGVLVIPVAFWVLDTLFLSIYTPPQFTLFAVFRSLWSEFGWGALVSVSMLLLAYGFVVYTGIWLFWIATRVRPAKMEAIPALVIGSLTLLILYMSGLWSFILSIREASPDAVSTPNEYFDEDYFRRQKLDGALALASLWGAVAFSFVLRLIHRAASVSNVEITTRRGVVKWENLRAEEASRVVQEFSAR